MYEYECHLPYCAGSRVTSFERLVCAGHSGPSRGNWERLGCC
ncbi:hypothetical protein OG914_15915 [Streptomyces sp. NBC_00291]|nr:hypothetical protein [Streptomyces sp. NBC_00291]MCX5155469.1 hypothetical protein [Streptomyces sp. NBC_00291]